MSEVESVMVHTLHYPQLKATSSGSSLGPGQYNADAYSNLSVSKKLSQKNRKRSRTE